SRDRLKAPADVRRRIRFGVEGVELTCASVLEQDDTGDLAPVTIGRQKLGQVETGKSQSAYLKKIAPATIVVKATRFAIHKMCSPQSPEGVRKFKTGRDREGEAPAEPHGARVC